MDPDLLEHTQPCDWFTDASDFSTTQPMAKFSYMRKMIFLHARANLGKPGTGLNFRPSN